MKWMRGYLFCEVSSGRWERFMNLCRHHDIKLWKIEMRECKVTFCMYARDYRQLRSFVGKTYVVPHICERRGLPFVWEQAKKNWTFTFGFLLFFAVLRILSLFVWQINYSGQREYTKETIQKKVTAMGVYPGMFRENLNCDSIERNLRECYENMSWVSAEEEGCVLNIKIKEGTAEKKAEEKNNAPFHLTAPRSGTIQSIVTKEGTAVVKKGSKVKKGDVLIQGIVEIKDDSETVVKKSGVCAAGEITLVSEKNYEDSINMKYMDKNKTGKNIHVYTIDWNGNRFSIKNPLKWFDNSSNYDIISNVCVEQSLKWWDASLKVTERSYIAYENCEAQYTEKEAEEQLKNKLASRLARYEEKGYQILDKTFQMEKGDVVCKGRGKIVMALQKMKEVPVTEEELHCTSEKEEK